VYVCCVVLCCVVWSVHQTWHSFFKKILLLFPVLMSVVLFCFVFYGYSTQKCNILASGSDSVPAPRQAGATRGQPTIQLTKSTITIWQIDRERYRDI